MDHLLLYHISDLCVVCFLSSTMFSNLTCFTVLHISSVIYTWLINVIICYRNAMLFILTLYCTAVYFDNWYNIVVPYRFPFDYRFTTLYVLKSVLLYYLFLNCDCCSFRIVVPLQLLLLYSCDSWVLYRSLDYCSF